MCPASVSSWWLARRVDWSFAFQWLEAITDTREGKNRKFPSPPTLSNGSPSLKVWYIKVAKCL
jgi:hypothetical protein